MHQKNIRLARSFLCARSRARHVKWRHAPVLLLAGAFSWKRNPFMDNRFLRTAQCVCFTDELPGSSMTPPQPTFAFTHVPCLSDGPRLPSTRLSRFALCSPKSASASIGFELGAGATPCSHSISHFRGLSCQSLFGETEARRPYGAQHSQSAKD